MDDLDAAYKKRFGHCPDFRWYRGDLDAYAVMIRKAVANKQPLPDYNEAHGIRADART